MTHNIHNFIFEMDNFLSKEWCDHTIEYFENMQKAGLVADRSNDAMKHVFDDNTLTMHGEYSIQVTGTQHLSDSFATEFWNKAYPIYTKQFSVLKTLATHSIYFMKAQKTEIGQGYHTWHCETGDRASSTRLMAFILYLNDVEDGGETEFLYYPCRIKPKTGKLILFPGGYTHTHRGNPPLSGTKYILTGWVEF
jgi:hypothetical protein